MVSVPGSVSCVPRGPPATGRIVFPSLRLKGTKPPAANMLVSDYLRVAAKKAGVVAPPRSSGFHTFRRTLASVLVKMKVDPKLVQEMLRHQNLKTTLEIYAKAVNRRQARSPGDVPGVVVLWQENR
jgi:integrase